MLGKIIAGVLGGFVVASLAALVIALPFAGDPQARGQIGTIVFVVVWITVITVALMAPRAAKAWRWLLVSMAILSFSMPLATLIFAGVNVTQEAARGGEYAAVATVGAAVGGGVVTAMAGFLGFFLGVIFLVIGLLVGRDKEIVVIKESGPDLRAS